MHPSELHQHMKCIRPCRKLRMNVVYRIAAVTLSPRGTACSVTVFGEPGTYNYNRFAPLDKIDKFLMLRPVIKGAAKRKWRQWDE